MPFEMQLLPEKTLALVTARGTIDFDSSIGAMLELAHRPDFEPSFRVVADFRGIKYTPSFSDLKGFLKAFKEIRASYQGRLALVVKGRLHSALGKAACALGRLVSFEMRCFKDLDKARSWAEE